MAFESVDEQFISSSKLRITIFDSEFGPQIYESEMNYHTNNIPIILAVDFVINFYLSVNRNDVARNVFLYMRHMENKINWHMDRQIDWYSKYSLKFINYLPEIKKYLIYV